MELVYATLITDKIWYSLLLYHRTLGKPLHSIRIHNNTKYDNIIAYILYYDYYYYDVL